MQQSPSMSSQLYVTARDDWRAWLSSHHDTDREIWLVYYKKHSGKPRIPYDDAVEEALCFGWIDSIVRRIDDERFAQKFTPRTNTKRWSAINIERARRMIDSGRMTEAGLAKFHPEKSDQPAPPTSDEVPAFIEKAFKANARAWKNFTNLAPSYRRQYVGWISAAKRDATRLKRIAEAIESLKKSQKLGLK